MRRVSLIGLTAALTILTVGCEGGRLFGGGETTDDTQSPVAVSPVDEAETDEAEQTEQPTEEPTVTDLAPTDSEVVASLPADLDLIPSTDPDQRLQAIGGDRNDPFSLVPTTPSVQITITETPQPATPATAQAPAGQGTTVGQTPTTPAPTTTGAGQTTTQPGGTTATQPGGLAPIPNLVPQPSPPRVAAAPLPPPAPQPVLARAVEVLGVVQVGNTPYAIVNAPNEASSRYVRVGQRLSNGQVIVKRIEMNGPEPAVVFEQFGVEVITAVGEGGAPPEPSPTASLAPSVNPAG
jgi:hypothetical protein